MNICGFMALSTVFQIYQADGRVILKGVVRKNSPPAGIYLRSPKLDRPAVYLLSS